MLKFRLIFIEFRNNMSLRAGIAIFNILHDSSSSYLGDLFIRSTPSIRPSRLLSPDVFAISNFCASTFRNLFYPADIYFWHSLTDPVRSSPTVGILKGRLCRHLFDFDNDPFWCSSVSLGHSAGLGRPGPFLVLRYSVATDAHRLLPYPLRLYLLSLFFL